MADGNHNVTPGVHPASDVLSVMRAISVSGRHVPVGGTLNFRDIGGYSVGGGGSTAWRTLLRSDALHRLDRPGLSRLAQLNLRSVLDLRIAEEVRIAPSPLAEFASWRTEHTHLSLVGADFSQLPPELDGVYSFIVDKRSAAVGAAIKALARPGALPALVHCTAGKDRTGIVIAFTLAVIGVPDEFIAADYALSSMYLEADETPVIGQIAADSGLGDQLTEALLASPPELILDALDRARQQAGSIEGYLARNGLTRSDVAALRSVLVETSNSKDE
ncbi:MAG TPA: tyrosine-protein phosphatase [Streptosporangiaceae bacterium]|nr:tyrosine-protein phosphatase [Streptosporangiaceae bacterium]